MSDPIKRQWPGVAETSEYGVEGIPSDADDMGALLVVAELGVSFSREAALSTKWARYRDAAAAEMARAGLRGVTFDDLLTRLVRGGFLEEAAAVNGRVIGYRISRQSQSGLLACAASGCTEDEIRKGPAWIREALLGGGEK